MAPRIDPRDQRRIACFLTAAALLIGAAALLTASAPSDNFLRRRDEAPPDRNHHRRRRLHFTHLSEYLDPKAVEAKPYDASRTATADDGEGIPPQQRPDRGGRRQLIHVFNPYARGGESDSDVFSPVGYEQWIMLASVRDAQHAFNSRYLRESGGSSSSALALFHSVTLVCAVVEHDLQPLSTLLAKYCDHVSILTHTTATENRLLKPLPFLQDVIDAGASMADGDEFHLMLTNADISLAEGFYTFAERTLRERNTAALSFNRMTLGLDQVPLLRLIEEGREQPSEEMDALLERDENSGWTWPSGVRIAPDSSFDDKDQAARGFMIRARKAVERNRASKHPGHDCFVMHSSALGTIRLGELFLGYPSWGADLHIMLKIMIPGYTAVKSDRFGTFHIGNQLNWARSADETYWENYGAEELRNVYYCPHAAAPPPNVHTLQQLINCGRLFRPASSENIVPGFVRAGHERVYLANYHKMLAYTDEGIPYSAARGREARQKLVWLPERGVTLPEAPDPVAAATEAGDGTMEPNVDALEESVVAVADAGGFDDAAAAAADWESPMMSDVDAAGGSIVAADAAGSDAGAHAGGPTFVFVVGLEGVGHHLVGDLLSRSPNMEVVDRLGLCSNRPGTLKTMALAMFQSKGRNRPSGGLFDPHLSERPEFDSRNLYNEIVASMAGIGERVQTAFSADGIAPPSSSFRIPLNANGCGRGHGMTQMSYPNMRGGEGRHLAFPNLDVYYNACADAGADCRHVYVYRDPVGVLASTGRRGFNADVLEGIRLYTQQLLIIYAQLSFHAGRTDGCFGFLDAEGSGRIEDVDRFGSLFGWGSPEEFREVYRATNARDPASMTNGAGGEEGLVPPEYDALMRAYLDVHQRVVDLCYSSLGRSR